MCLWGRKGESAPAPPPSLPTPIAFPLLVDLSQCPTLKQRRSFYTERRLFPCLADVITFVGANILEPSIV